MPSHTTKQVPIVAIVRIWKKSRSSFLVHKQAISNNTYLCSYNSPLYFSWFVVIHFQVFVSGLHLSAGDLSFDRPWESELPKNGEMTRSSSCTLCWDVLVDGPTASRGTRENTWIPKISIKSRKYMRLALDRWIPQRVATEALCYPQKQVTACDPHQIPSMIIVGFGLLKCT